MQAEALEAILQAERKATQAKDARHKLTEDRLRRQIAHLQVRSMLALHRAWGLVVGR